MNAPTNQPSPNHYLPWHMVNCGGGVFFLWPIWPYFYILSKKLINPPHYPPTPHKNLPNITSVQPWEYNSRKLQFINEVWEVKEGDKLLLIISPLSLSISLSLIWQGKERRGQNCCGLEVWVKHASKTELIHFLKDWRKERKIVKKTLSCI